MDSRKWKKIEEAVIAASEISGGRRGAWVEEFCAEDAGIKRRNRIRALPFDRSRKTFLEKIVSSYAVQILTRDERVFPANIR